jgi:hypothetical protein
MKSVALFAAICAVAAPISAAADSMTFTYSFPSPLLGYINEDGSAVPLLDADGGGILNSVTLHGAVNTTWSGGASTDDNSARYVIGVGGVFFGMSAENLGNGTVGASIDTPVPTTFLSEFIGLTSAPTSVSVANTTAGTNNPISSTFLNETVTYEYTAGAPSVPGAPLFTNTGPESSGPPPTTPLPTALPLFATGLGALGLLGWRRKRKARVSLLGPA